MKYIALIPSLNPDDKLIPLLKELKKLHFDIVLVNDGSDKKYDDLFKQSKKYAHVLSYSENKGKGYALKEGMLWIQKNEKPQYVVVTLDSDGQHQPSDAKKLADYASTHRFTLTLGSRKKTSKMPLRSKIGNTLTRYVYRLHTGIKIYDTQTGLRAFSDYLMNYMLSVNGNRYEYEMNVLLYLKANQIQVHELEIETIYYEKNAGTHFHTLKDSYSIYKEIAKFSGVSICSFLIDYVLFLIFKSFLPSITYANILSRLISASMNYYLNRKFVFKYKKKGIQTFGEYAILAIGILGLNTTLLNIFVTRFGLTASLAKILTEIILFLFSYIVQKYFIFKKEG